MSSGDFWRQIVGEFSRCGKITILAVALQQNDLLPKSRGLFTLLRLHVAMRSYYRRCLLSPLSQDYWQRLIRWPVDTAIESAPFF